MKKIFLTTVLVSSFMFLGCYSGDDDPFIELEINDAIVLENEGEYELGDTIFFEIRFSRYLEEEGFDTLLDIYETTGANQYSYNFDLSKFSNFTNNFERVSIDPAFIIIEEGGDDEDSFRSFVVLNDEQTEYVTRVGVVLQESGEFRIDFGSTFFPDYVKNGIRVSVSHEFSAVQPEDFIFIVTE